MRRLKRYNQVGWLCITYSILLIPFSTIIDEILGYDDLTSKSTAFILSAISAGLIAYIFLSFKELINLKFKFFKINTLIDIYVVAILVAKLFYFILPSTFALVLMGIAQIFSGIIQAVFSIKLLDIDGDGKFKALSISMLLTGILIGSIGKISSLPLRIIYLK
ncbi:hypothetical protein PM10SUCC1_36310 [Propionigenium maris DSM 9537]|uniref:Uncharacterized protein n=1 Tax=Propionigenium maris DSM 9537 TaxID=1123000 RepID=A0A9W6GP80_9FUSO|nr:hypothetical protein [Propionigenium maris]GLI58117.1 hypothetical protein PM10SUCC1_36310 [Propionigenium maris DSM 9537]